MSQQDQEPTMWKTPDGRWRDETGLTYDRDFNVDKQAMKEQAMEWSEAVEWFQTKILPDIFPQLFWEVSSFTITEDGRVVARRKAGRPKGSKDLKPRTRRWAKRPDADDVVWGVERREDGTLYTAPKTVGEIAAKMRTRLEEDEGASDTSIQPEAVAPLDAVSLPPSVVVPASAPEKSTPVDVDAVVDTVEPEAPVVAPFRLNFKKVNNDD